ncbi:MAG: sigma 54-interacting transcriptional regulator, partial [Nitrospira sp.]|nr:sigma 54-interacting transcriptional regulator [Nitrospira sp.]
MTSPVLQGSAIGLLASLLAGLVWVAAPATYTALDWALYDTWLSRRAPIAASPNLAIVVRDPLSDDRFGAGPLDRAMLAELVTAVHEADAAVIGLDDHLDHVNPTQRGGAAADALLRETLSSSGPVVTVIDQDTPSVTDRTESLMQGHLLLTPHADHVVRLAPSAVEIGSRPVLPFGHILSVSDRQGMGGHHASNVINFVGDGSLSALPTLPLSSVWDAVQRHDHDSLSRWFTGKVVVILPNPLPHGSWLLPTGQQVPAIAVHVHLLNNLLTDNHIRPMDSMGRTALTVVFATLVALGLLRVHGTVGVILAAAGIAVYLALPLAALSAWQLVLPVTLPMTASGFVVLGTTMWTHVTAGQRMRLLELDMLRLQQNSAAVREALILRENRVEALQEDLEAAKEAAARSTSLQQDLVLTTETLRAELADVQTQEQTARLELEQMERQLHDLRAASWESAPISDSTLEQLRGECRQLGILTQSPTVLRIFRDVKKGAKAPLTALLLGEPGTGKELFARAIHRLSPRAGNTFIAVNMAAISPELFESELFGHMKGSFTGAMSDRRGYFELANRGTIFLDEIGDLRLDHQSKLLRVLQERSFYRVGATLPTTVDVRIIAATNRDLQRGVSDGWFREDLYFRLKGLVFRLPPLHERTDDIPLLADAFSIDIAAQIGKPAPKLSHEALRTLVEHEWKGNVRELRHCLEQAITLSDGSLLSKESLRLTEDRAEASGRVRQILPDPASDHAVLQSLRRHGFDMQATAKALGWDRSTVTQRLKGLCFQALVESDGDHTQAIQAIAGDPSHVRTVELKLTDYHHHLLSVIEPFASADEALADCRRRFKNLPDRHFRSVESLVRKYFRKGPTQPV